MPYKVTGQGLNGIELAYDKATLSEAGYLASKMADNGVSNVRIHDELGAPVTLANALKALHASSPKRWRR